MALLDIRVLGDPVLREVTRPVAEVTPELRRLIEDMFETMYAARGIGLAAPQIGRLERIAVVDVDGPLVLVNPEIVESDGREKAEEGCLSIPDVYGDVERATRVVVKALDADGNEYRHETTDLRARCILHEVDHLHGRLFIDYLGPFKRRTALSKWAKEREKYPDSVRRLTPAEIAEHHHRDEEL